MVFAPPSRRSTDDTSPRAGGPSIHDQHRGTVAFVGDAALVAGVLAANPVAMAELFDRFAAPMLRLLTRVLGPDHEIADVHHDVFVRALSSIGRLRDPEALGGWMSAIAVHTARATIERRQRRRRWLSFLRDDELPEPDPVDPTAADDAREKLRATYAVLDKMPVDERIAFALRHVDGLELTEVAEACEVSLATIKRRLVRADQRFRALARQDPALADLVEGGAPWTR